MDTAIVTTDARDVAAETITAKYRISNQPAFPAARTVQYMADGHQAMAAQWLDHAASEESVEPRK